MTFPTLRPVALAPLLAVTLLAGCDVAEPIRPASFVEGTYILPDGTPQAFRSDAWARGYPGERGSPRRFAFGAVSWGPNETDEVRVGLTVTHYGSTLPQPGTYPSIGDGRGDAFAFLSLSNVPGLDAQGLNDPSLALVDFPTGSLTYTWDADGAIRGTFALEGHPFGTGEDVRVAAEGRFEIEVEP